ncbi:trypsin-like serine peptidase [Sandaracinus amylolyticus]|uniref:trypsin-like serine peptidase n=1 Tax=Sandaracinus amylolyticus TaxID=927083 RepID=UPI001F458A0F|nr:trypsin-like peptidase domain-containing protein [Sandaracinus amylolyticus]
MPSSCTATLLDVGGDDDAPAYALTAGHCTLWWENHRSFEDRALDEPGEVVFRFFTDTVDAQESVAVEIASFSSMRGTDLAVLALDTTVGALREAGIEGLSLASALPATGSAITNVGAPLATTDDPEEHLRLGRCALGERTSIVEFEWLWPDTVAHDCPEIRTGSSGSPLLDASGAIFAVVNTTGEERPHALCHLGRPCELETSGPATYDGVSYAIPVAGLGACFADGALDLGAAGCPLASGPVIESARETDRYQQPGDARTIRVTLTASEGFTHYRAKTGPAQSTDCRDDAGYGAAVAIDAQPTFETPLPGADGLTVVCVRGGPSADAIQPATHAIAWVTATDSTPPALPLPVRHDPPESDSVRFWVDVENPTYAGYDRKSGPAATTDCDDPEGYTFVNVRFGQFTVASEGGPTRVCVVASDWAENVSEPMEWVFFE